MHCIHRGATIHGCIAASIGVQPSYETADAMAAMAVVMHAGGGVSEEKYDDSGKYARFEDRRWSLLVMVFLLARFEAAWRDCYLLGTLSGVPLVVGCVDARNIHNESYRCLRISRVLISRSQSS